MGLLKCIAGHLSACHGSSEKIKGSVFSNRGAIVNIILRMNAGSISTGTGILIHRALILTTHGTLPSISAAQESDILVSQRGVGDSEEYGRKLAPERFFVTSSVLDLTVVACDPTGTEVAQPLCLHNSLVPCLDFGSTVYLLGRQQIEEQGKDLAVGDGKIIVETDTLIKFSTDGSNWSPGSAGFDVYGNLAFMVCDPKKLVSTMASPQRKRAAAAAAAAFWRKDTPKQFGIPVPIVRHWLSQHWEGSIEELDRPRVPARLKVSQKEQSAESSSGSVKLKRAEKQKEHSKESSSNLEKCKRTQKQKEDDEDVSSIPVGPESEILDRSGIALVVEIEGIQIEKKNDSSTPAVSHNLDVGRSRTPEEEGSISNVDGSNYQIQRELEGKLNSPAQQKEQHLDKACVFSEEHGGPSEEQHLDKLIIVTQKEQDAEQTGIAAHSKGPPEEERQDLFGTKMAHKESIIPHQSEIQKVIIPAPQIENLNEKQQHKAICKEVIPTQPIEVSKENQEDVSFPKMVCKQTFPMQPTEVSKENQQRLDINFPKAVSEDTIPSLPTEIPRQSPRRLDITFPKAVCKKTLLAQPTEIPKESQQYLDFNFSQKECKETLPEQPTEIPKENQQLLETNIPKVVCKETALTQPNVDLKGKQQLLDISFPPKHKKEREEQTVLLHFKDPRSCICRELKDIDESKQAKGDSSNMQDVLNRPKAEQKEPLFCDEYEKCREKSSSEVKGPKMTIRLRLQDLDEKKQTKEDTLSAQEIWETPIDECTESKIPHQHERDTEKWMILEKLKAPVSTVHVELQQPEEQKQIEEVEQSSQKIGNRAKAECKESNCVSLNKKHRDKSVKQSKQAVSSIHIELKHTEEKKGIQGQPSCSQEVWKRPIVECMESNVPAQHEKVTEQPIGLAQFKDPMSRSIRIESKPMEGKKQIQVGPSSLQGLWKRPQGECAESQFPARNEIHREKSLSYMHLKDLKEPASAIPVEVKHIVKMEEVQEAPLKLSEVGKRPEAVYDAYKTKEGTVAELNAKADCIEDGLLQDFATKHGQTGILSQASSLRDTDSSDVETMYSAETRESRNYSPRESDGKKKLQQARRSQSSLSSRGVRNWNCNARNSLQGRPRSALPMYNNQVHPSCTRRISLQMPSYKCPDYFGPTVSSIMKKRNPDLANNTKASVVQLSPRWIF